MEIKQLSSNLLAEKIVIITGFLLSTLVYLIIPDFLILYLIVLIFIGLSVYSVYFLVSNISYDENYLYLKQKKEQKTVELNNIIQIKITPHWGSWRRMWKVKYVENEKEGNLYFYLKYGYFTLNPFIKQVKLKNPFVECLYITFDLDID